MNLLPVAAALARNKMQPASAVQKLADVWLMNGTLHVNAHA